MSVSFIQKYVLCLFGRLFINENWTDTFGNNIRAHTVVIISCNFVGQFARKFGICMPDANTPPPPPLPLPAATRAMI